MPIIMNGLIDIIKDIKEKAKCPFCNNPLTFNAVSNEYSSGTRVKLTCENCKLEFTLVKKTHKKEVNWYLDEVRTHY